MRSNSVFRLVLLTVFALLLAAPASAVRIVTYSPIVDGTWTDKAFSPLSTEPPFHVFEVEDTTGPDLKVQAGPVSADVSRGFLEFDLSAITEPERILSASLVLSSSVALGEPGGPLTYVLGYPSNMVVDMADGFGLGAFPFATGRMGIDVTLFVRERIAAAASGLAFMLRAMDGVERGQMLVEQFFRSSEFQDPDMRPALVVELETPEPDAGVLLLTGLVLAGGWRKYRARKPAE